mgnify:CR=1 FL=1
MLCAQNINVEKMSADVPEVSREGRAARTERRRGDQKAIRCVYFSISARLVIPGDRVSFQTR